MNAVQKLRDLVGQIRRSSGSPDSRAAWELAQRLLSRLPVDKSDALRACSHCDLDLLDSLVARLESPAPHPHPASNTSPAPGSDGSASADSADLLSTEAGLKIDSKVMDRALRAFRKRLKLARLSEESSLGGRQLTSGRKSQIHAILPPHEFPSAVWPALERAGKLRHAGQGFYALP